MLFRKYVLLLVASMIAALFLGSCTPTAMLEPTTTQVMTRRIATASSPLVSSKTLTPTQEPTETFTPLAPTPVFDPTQVTPDVIATTTVEGAKPTEVTISPDMVEKTLAGMPKMYYFDSTTKNIKEYSKQGMTLEMIGPTTVVIKNKDGKMIGDGENYFAKFAQDLPNVSWYSLTDSSQETLFPINLFSQEMTTLPTNEVISTEAYFGFSLPGGKETYINIKPYTDAQVEAGKVSCGIEADKVNGDEVLSTGIINMLADYNKVDPTTMKKMIVDGYKLDMGETGIWDVGKGIDIIWVRSVFDTYGFYKEMLVVDGKLVLKVAVIEGDRGDYLTTAVRDVFGDFFKASVYKFGDCVDYLKDGWTSVGPFNGVIK
jgi:hypothetical protein